MKTFAVTAAMIATGWLMVANASEIKVDGQKIRLHSTSATLLATLERQWGLPISISLDRANPRNFQGESAVNDVGIRITLHHQSADETTLVHELLHLQLKAEGYSDAVWDLSRVPSSQRDNLAKMLAALRSRLRDPVLHFIGINPRSRALGIDPTADTRRDLEDAVSSGSFGASTRGVEPWLTLEFFMVDLEIDDRGLVARAADLYRSKGWTRALDTAQSMAETVRKAVPLNPESEAALFVRLLQTVAGSDASFTFVRLVIRRQGKIDVRGAIIAVAPRSP